MKALTFSQNAMLTTLLALLPIWTCGLITLGSLLVHTVIALGKREKKAEVELLFTWNFNLKHFHKEIKESFEYLHIYNMLNKRQKEKNTIRNFIKGFHDSDSKFQYSTALLVGVNTSLIAVWVVSLLALALLRTVHTFRSQ